MHLDLLIGLELSRQVQRVRKESALRYHDFGSGQSRRFRIGVAISDVRRDTNGKGGESQDSNRNQNVAFTH